MSPKNISRPEDETSLRNKVSHPTKPQSRLLGLVKC